jgi:hypothetical protein
MANASADVRIDNHGSILIVNGLTEAGREWMDNNLASDALTWGAHGIVVEPRYLGDIVEGMINDGLEVQ